MENVTHQQIKHKGTKMEDFIREINTLRKVNKNAWYTWVGSVEGKEVSLKGFGTWLELFKVDGIDYSNPMERAVGQFKDDLEAPFLELHDDVHFIGGMR